MSHFNTMRLQCNRDLYEGHVPEVRAEFEICVQNLRFRAEFEICFNRVHFAPRKLVRTLQLADA